MREKQRRYEQTEKGRATKQRYEDSPKGTLKKALRMTKNYAERRLAAHGIEIE